MAKIAKWSPTPHLHSRSSTQQMMNEFTAVLIAVSLFALIVYGYQWGMEYAIKGALIIVTAIVAAILTETVYFTLQKKFSNVYEWLAIIAKSYPIITSLLLALCLPIGTPLPVVAVGSGVAIFLGKLVFGGVGYNPFNPALIGRAFVTITWGGLLTTTLVTTDAVSSVTPLVNLSQQGHIGTYETVVGPYGNMWTLLVGNYPSAIGESVSIAIILAAIYLIAKKIIDWRIPVFYLGTVFIMTWIIGAMNGISGIWYPVFHLLTGGILFGAVFMATDLVTSPVARKGKIVFALGLALLTVIIRLLGNYPEGVFFSILFMNLFKPVIDRCFMGRMSLPLKTSEKVFWFSGGIIVVLVAVLIGALI
ncbi:MAG TPA: electron transporter RnfD [Firmicutes bacterium]|nr:electron transporter RnfD [Bacillota bacterium]